MCALLAVGYVLFFACADHDAVVLRGRVGEEFHPANRNFVRVGNLNGGKRGSLREPRLQQYPEVADEHPHAREREKLRELPARGVTVVARENRKLVLPERLLIGAANKRHTTPPTCSPRRRVKRHRFQPEPSCTPL